jgi:hypothetical protein
MEEKATFSLFQITQKNICYQEMRQPLIVAKHRNNRWAIKFYYSPPGGKSPFI